MVIVVKWIDHQTINNICRYFPLYYRILVRWILNVYSLYICPFCQITTQESVIETFLVNNLVHS